MSRSVRCQGLVLNCKTWGNTSRDLMLNSLGAPLKRLITDQFQDY